MKILFLDPPGYQRQGYNLGLAMLCSALAREGHQAIIFDRNEGGDLNQVITAFAPELVGISVKSATFSAGRRLAHHVREVRPEAVVLAGGPHPTIEPADFLAEGTSFDLALAGEAEEAIVELCRRLEGVGASLPPAAGDPTARRQVLAERLNGGAGLTYRDVSGRLVQTPPVIIEDLDLLPFPRLESFINLDAASRPYHMMTSRGCPFRCAYCSVRSIAGRKLRTRSVEAVVEELVFARSYYRIQGFEVDDDNFTLQLDRAKLICEAMLQRNLDTPWYLPNGIRAEFLDSELAYLLARANCHTVALGIESADPQVLRVIHKGLSPDSVKRAVELLHAVGIRVMGFFIIGLPGSSLQSDLSTIAFERALPLDDRIYNAFVPYPCTEGYEWAKEHGKFLADYRDALHFSDREVTVFETPDYPEPQRKAALALARLGTRSLNPDDFSLLRNLVLTGLDQDTLLIEVESYLPDLHRVLELFTPLTLIQVRDRTTQEVLCREPDGHISSRTPLRPGLSHDLSLVYGLGRALAGRRFHLAIVPQIHSYLFLSLLARCNHRFQYTYNRRLSSVNPQEILVDSPQTFLRRRLRGALRTAVPDPVAGAEQGYLLIERVREGLIRLRDLTSSAERLPDWLAHLPTTAGLAATSQASIAALRLRRWLASMERSA